MNAVKSKSLDKCVPCGTLTDPLSSELITEMLCDLPNWCLDEKGRLFRDFKFKNFGLGLDFVNKVGDRAESQGHHPDIYLSWGKVRITFWTHKIGGLSINDFVMAKETDRLYGNTK